MALIKCSECGNKVSDKAKNCPNCGNPINTKENTNNVSLITFSIAFVCLVISFFINPFGLMGIVAIICSIITIVQTKKSVALIGFSVFILLVSIGVSYFYVTNLMETTNKVKSTLSTYK